jgi:hypothetical protein
LTTYISGAQHTLAINQNQRKLAIHPKIYYLQEDLTPLVILTWGKGKNGLPVKKKVVGNPKFTVLSKQPHEAWTAINAGGGYTASIVTFAVDAASHITPGMLLQDAISAEIMHVKTRNSSTQITVDRSIGPTAAGTIADNTPLMIVGNVNAENASYPEILMVKVREADNYCEIFRKPCGSSGTLENSDLIGSKSRPDLRKETWLEHRKGIERAFLFGEPFEDTSVVDSSGNPARGTGGVYYWINSAGNVTSVATTLTKTIWRTFSRNLFKYGKKRKVVLCSPLVIDALDFWKDGKLQMTPSEEFYNIRVAEWITGHGTMVIMKDEELDDSPYGSGGHGDLAIGLDPDNLSFCHLANRDSALLTNRQNPGVDGWVDETLAEAGLGYVNPETGHILEGITEYS